MKLFTLLIGLILAAASQATEYVYLGAWSHHLQDRDDKVTVEYIPPPQGSVCLNLAACSITIVEKQYYNETHQLIGYQKNGYLLAHYTNSFDQSTWLAARQFESAPRHHFSLMASFGITYGYTDCDYEDSGNNATACPDYQLGIAYTEFKLQPILATNGSVITLSFRLKI